ncbi:hypothetical protein V6R21_19930 [Limibacter armeniacum]|uniref:hypothetical protein n=1 Tax=Limibacter armeniacum TaxID=466084 RepID=UPI002FE51F42
MIKSKLSALIFCVFLIGCGVPQQQYDALKKENETLKAQLDDCQFGASKLLESAESYFGYKNYLKAKDDIAAILEKHPSSPEAEKAKVLLGKVDVEIKKKEEATRKKIEEKKKQAKLKVEKATRNMRKSHDDIRNITWYYDKSSPRYVNSRSNVHLYFGKRGINDVPSLWFVIQYVADDWLFIDKYIIKVGDKTYNISEERNREVKTDHGSGQIWEWIELSAGKKEIEIAKAIANGKNVKIRYNGRQYYRDRVITSAEKTAIKNVLIAYEALGGKVN